MADNRIKITVTFIGEDLTYWQNIQKFYLSDNGEQYNTTFLHLMKKADETVAKTFLKLYTEKPKIVYLDFCKRSDEILYLCKIMKQNEKTANIVTVGLFDNLTRPDIKREAIMNGVNLNFIKGLEVRPAIYGPMDVAVGDSYIPSFAKAELEHSTKFNQLVRIRSMNSTSMKIETNHLFQDGEDVYLKTSFLPPPNKFSHYHKIKLRAEENLYTDCKYIYDVDFYIIDPIDFLKNEDDEEEDAEAMVAKKLQETAEGATKTGASEKENEAQRALEKKRAERIAKIKRAEESFDEDKITTNKKINDFIQNNHDKYVPKKTKVLIIDKDISIVEQCKGNIFYDLQFKIFLQSFLTDPLKKLKHRMAHLIVFEHETLPEMSDAEKTLFDENVEKVKKINEELKMEYKVKNKDKADNQNYIPPDEDIEQALFALRATPDSQESKRKVAFTLKCFHQEVNRNSLDQFKNLVNAAKQIEGYNPIIFFYNSQNIKTDDLKKELDYDQIIAHPNNFEFNQFIKMAELFKKKLEEREDKLLDTKLQKIKQKDPVKYRKLTKADLQGGLRVYFDEKQQSSTAACPRKITLLSISEAELTFKLDNTDNSPLDMHTPFSMYWPVQMGITVVPFRDEKDAIPGGYRALIHSIGEIELQKLRQFINSIFFADKDKEKEAEAEEIEALKDKYLEQKRIEESKAKAESGDSEDNSDDSSGQKAS